MSIACVYSMVRCAGADAIAKFEKEINTRLGEKKAEESTAATTAQVAQAHMPVRTTAIYSPATSHQPQVTTRSPIKAQPITPPAKPAPQTKTTQMTLGNFNAFIRQAIQRGILIPEETILSNMHMVKNWSANRGPLNNNINIFDSEKLLVTINSKMKIIAIKPRSNNGATFRSHSNDAEGDLLMLVYSMLKPQLAQQIVDDLDPNDHLTASVLKPNVAPEIQQKARL